MALPNPPPSDPGEPAAAAGSDPDVRTVLGPLLAGARDEGVADGLEMLGVGVVLIDATGRVVRVGRRGQRLLAGWLRIVAGHLVAERTDDEGAVAGLIGAALAVRPSPSGIRLRMGIDAPVLTLRAILVPHPDGSSGGSHAAIVLDEA